MAQAYASSETKAFDNLFAGLEPAVKADAIVLEAGSEVRGTLLGKKTKSTPTTGTADPGNTGNGTITSVVAKPKTKLGVYKILMTGATTLRVIDPDGIELDSQAALGAYSNNSIGFTSAAGGTPLIAGDFFTITVTAGNGKYIKSLSAAVDGTQDPVAVLAEDMDASSAEQTTLGYVRGCFNEDKLIYGTGHTKSSVKEALRARDIYLETVAETPLL